MAIEGIYLARPAGYPAPFLQAVVELPRLGLSNEVDFPLDTGADNTVLNPFDILNLNLDRTRLHPPDARSRGIGGQLDYHTEPANLHFLDGQTIITRHCENLRICADIADPTLARLTESIPSLLGRNFLNLCLTLADPLHNQFSLEPYQTTAQGPGSAVIS